MNPLEQYLQDRLDERKAEGTLRALRMRRDKIDFFSNDYLGLASGKYLHDCMSRKPGGYPLGATGSRLLSGNTELAENLEARIATFHHAEAALLFNSGYNANTALAACLGGTDTLILYDERCHASIIDGIRLSKATRKFRFAHNNLPDLQEKIAKFGGQGPVVVFVESLYSMDGDCAPLPELVSICTDNNAHLVVDEAHATGVFGPRGEGLVCHLGLQQQVFARIHTYGKAMGCHGAAIVGSELLKQYLVNFARPFIYTTALPDHSLQVIHCAYNFLESPEYNQDKLWELVSRFRSGIRHSGMAGWGPGESPIQALIVGDVAKCRSLSQRLLDSGFQVNPIFAPTVPPGAERLRFCLHTFNTIEQVDRIFEVLADTE